MTSQQLHEIAIAYAQVKLQVYQEQHKDAVDYNPVSCDSDELHYFAKAYRCVALSLHPVFPACFVAMRLLYVA